ncbi:MAG: hypothetical protein ACKPKO_02720, partial [Candidatus Fonsibacter sp.]
FVPHHLHGLIRGGVSNLDITVLGALQLLNIDQSLSSVFSGNSGKAPPLAGLSSTPPPLVVATLSASFN